MPNELMHYGILGQKWGVRRYQNEDGSLTNAGKKRYNKEISPDHYVLPDSKQPYELSNKELKKRIDRMKLENEYTDYYNHIMDDPNKINSNKGDISKKGESFFQKYKTQVTAGLVGGLSSGTIAMITKIVGNIIKKGSIV